MDVVVDDGILEIEKKWERMDKMKEEMDDDDT